MEYLQSFMKLRWVVLGSLHHYWGKSKTHRSDYGWLIGSDAAVLQINMGEATGTAKSVNKFWTNRVILELDTSICRLHQGVTEITQRLNLEVE